MDSFQMKRECTEKDGCVKSVNVYGKLLQW